MKKRQGNKGYVVNTEFWICCDPNDHKQALELAEVLADEMLAECGLREMGINLEDLMRNQF